MSILDFLIVHQATAVDWGFNIKDLYICMLNLDMCKAMDNKINIRIR